MSSEGTGSRKGDVGGPTDPDLDQGPKESHTVGDSVNSETIQDVTPPRQSFRERKLTLKAQENTENAALKLSLKFQAAYLKWKQEAKTARTLLKNFVAESDGTSMLTQLNASQDSVQTKYDRLRKLRTPTREETQRADRVAQVTSDIKDLLQGAIAIKDVDFNATTALFNTRAMLSKKQNPTIFGDSVTESEMSLHSRASGSHHSRRSGASKNSVGSRSSVVSSSKTDAAADLAASKARLKALQELQAQERKIKAEEERLQLLKAQAEVDVAEARAQVYQSEQTSVKTSPSVVQAKPSQSVHAKTSQSVGNAYLPLLNKDQTLNPAAPTFVPRPSSDTASSTSADIASMLLAFQEGITLGRLPVPEPAVFRGDPLHFPEWKNSFSMLIEGRKIGAADKLFYLRKYTAGPASKVIQGAFFRSDEAAYQDAWCKLSSRYGDPFLIQRAFRQKIASWPNVSESDAGGLREFSDFLSSCNDALPHIKGLKILNDCEENRKMVAKLPGRISGRWNRRVRAAMKGHSYPSFAEFCEFLHEESEIANGPLTSSISLKSAPAADKEVKQSKRRVLSTKVTQAVAPDATSTPESTYSASAGSSPSCTYCEEAHTIYKCDRYSKLTLDERTQFAREKRLCFGCLRKGHMSKECKKRATCAKCKKSHPTLLHYDQRDRTTEGTHTATSCHTASGREVSSMVLPVRVTSEGSKEEVLTYAMLDTQSDSSYLLGSIAETLGAHGTTVRLKLATMTSVADVSECIKLSGISIRGLDSEKKIPISDVYTRDFIPSDVALIATSDTARRWPHLNAITDQLPPLQDCDIGMLIGFDCTTALIPREVIAGHDDEPFAVKTDLGWSIVGGDSRGPSVCHKVSSREAPVMPREVLKVLERDFSDEPGGKVSQEDIQFLKMLDTSSTHLDTGHLEMPLPFKSRPQLPDNKSQASARLGHLKRKFVKDPKYHRDYTKFMEDIISKGEAEGATSRKANGEIWYIPHHGVYHPRKPDKIRVVFDCSSRHGSTSLNDHLLSGPDLTNALVGVLCRFRKHPIAVVCDVERMFHQFLVRPEDRDFLRFLWWPNGDISQIPVHYRMKVHLFGAASSPGCANYGLKYLADKYKEELPLASSFIRDQFYVDDGLTSLSTPEEAIDLIKESRDLCARGSLRLHKFVSNNREVLESIPTEERDTAIKDVDLNKETLPISTTLGIQWDVEKDEFFFKMQGKNIVLTRRGILSIVSSIYDPLGFLAPFVLPGKILLQHMCRTGTGWDDPLPPDLEPQWNKWVSDFDKIASLRIPRCVIPANLGAMKSMELHHFSDASNLGYGQCSYLRVQDLQGKVNCMLLMAKARVAPSKVTTIPRLELAAAVTSVKVSWLLKEELHLSSVKEVFWTDSQVVLGYICNEAKRFHTFVANRIQMIRDGSSPEQWCYVDTHSNPADYASRGLPAEALLQSDWYVGPQFLRNPELICVPWSSPNLSLEDPEVRKVSTFKTTLKHMSLASRLPKFSSWMRLVGAIARLKRRAKGIISTDSSSLKERLEASQFLVALVQHEELKDGPPLADLDTFTDEKGIRRVGGRLRLSTLPFAAKHPAIIPKESHLAQLLISHYHARIGHQGRGMTQNEVRANGFWIVGGSSAVSAVLHRCVTCRRKRSSLQEQKMADLPQDRVEATPPFSFCGMDCFGPCITKNGRKESKRWGLLFTCLCSRAVHVEMLDDLTTDAFINGLRCFLSIRGKVSQIRSDQGSNFVGAQNELAAALKEVKTDRIRQYLTNQDCEFLMNPPAASHRGGVWERQIRTVKAAIQGITQLCPGRLDDSSLRTVFYEAMAIVNSRPLTVDSLNNATSPEPLTPNHILTMKSSVPLPPPGHFVPQDMYLRKRWRRVQFLVEQFWSRWRKEYLQSLNKRHRWTKPRRNVKCGDVVLLAEPDTPRNVWPLGIVVQTEEGADNLVRKVMVKISRDGKLSTLERPVQKLVVLVEAQSLKAGSGSPAVEE